MSLLCILRVVWCLVVICLFFFFCFLFFFCQAEDGIRDLVRSRGLGDVYKRQPMYMREELVVRPIDLLALT